MNEHYLSNIIFVALMLFIITQESNAFTTCSITKSIHTKQHNSQSLRSIFLSSKPSTSTSDVEDDNDNDESESQDVKSKGKRMRNEKAQAIFKLIEDRYGSIKSDEWSKARRYIYHVTATSDTITSPMASSFSNFTNYSNTNTPTPARKRRRDPMISEMQFKNVISYLEHEFNDQLDDISDTNNNNNNNKQGEKTSMVPFILQNVPRILKRNVDTQIKPTVDFLKQLYKPNGMFYIAIQRNPTLLLTSGVNNNDTMMMKERSDNKAGKNKKIAVVRNELNDDKSESDSINGGDEENCNDQSNNKNVDDTLSSIESFLLASDLGFTKKSVGKVTSKLTMHSSSFLAMEATESCNIIEEKVRPLVQFLSSVMDCDPCQPCVDAVEQSKRRKVIGGLISSNPKILTLNLQSNIVPKIQYLQSIGVATNTAADEDRGSSTEFILNICKKFPCILGLSLESNIKPTIDLIKCVIHSTIHDAYEIIGESNLKGSVDSNTLSSLTRSNVQHEYSNVMILKKVLTQHPQLLGLSKANLQSKIQYFNVIDYMDCTNKNFVNGDGTYSPSLAAKVMTLAPSVYSLSLKENIIPTVAYLANLWGVDVPSSLIASKMITLPLPKVDSIEKRKAQSLGRRISEYPLILTLSLEGNIQPTINFYNRTGYIQLIDMGKHKPNDDDNDDKQSYKTNSNVYLPARYIATSLFKKLLPRWNYYVVEETKRINKLESSMRQKQVIDGSVEDDEESITIPTSPPPLYLIASSSDSQFCKQMNYDEALYSKFKNEAVPRLKFSSQFDTWLKTGRPIDI